MKRIAATGIGLIVGLMSGTAHANCPQSSGWVCNVKVDAAFPNQFDLCTYFRVAGTSTWYAVPLFDFTAADAGAWPYYDGSQVTVMVNEARLFGEPIGFFTHQNSDSSGAPLCSWP